MRTEEKSPIRRVTQFALAAPVFRDRRRHSHSTDPPDNTAVPAPNRSIEARHSWRGCGLYIYRRQMLPASGIRSILVRKDIE